MISINLDEEVVRIGDQVSGTASWTVDSKDPKAVTATLRWYTEGRGDQDRDEVDSVTQKLDGPAAGLRSLVFSLRVPDDAPVNYDGMLIRIRWEVNIELDIPWGRDHDHQSEVWVLPR